MYICRLRWGSLRNSSGDSNDTIQPLVCEFREILSLARRAGNEKADASPAISYPHLLDPTFVYLYASQPPSMFLTRNPAVGWRSSLAGLLGAGFSLAVWYRRGLTPVASAKVTGAGRLQKGGHEDHAPFCRQ